MTAAKQTQGTPGPWAVAVAHGEARLVGSDKEFSDADARLIAAAPELLAVLDTLVNYFAESHALEIDAQHYGDDTCSYCEAIDAALIAIAKAKGTVDYDTD